MDVAIRKEMILVTTLLLFLSSYGLLAPVTAQGIHSVEISDLDPPEVEVDVLWGKIGHAYLTGSVTVEKAPAGDVEVNLVPYCSNAWTIAVYPDFMSFETAGTKYFTVTVDISLYAMANERADIEVVAHTKFPDTTTQEDRTSAIVSIKPIFSVHISTDPKIGIKNPQKFKLAITNMGNGPDSFTMDIGNQKYVEENGFTIKYSSQTTKEMIPRESDQTALEVSYKSTTRWGEHTIKLKAISMAAEMEGNTTYSATVDIVMNVGSLEGGGPETYTFFSIIILVIILVSALVIIRRRKGKRKRNGRMVKKKGK